MALETVENRNRIEESVQQLTLVAGEDLGKMAFVELNAEGRIVAAGADSMPLGIITRNVRAGDPVTVIRRGVVDGYDLDDVPYGTRVSVDADGMAVETDEETNSVGVVIPVTGRLSGASYDKLLLVECN